MRIAFTQPIARVSLLVVVAVALACEVSVPSGVFSCAKGQACPPGQTCGRDLLCRTGTNSPERDAQSGDGDASTELDGAADSGERDAESDAATAGTGGSGGSSGADAGRGGGGMAGEGPGEESFRVIGTNPSAESPVHEDLAAEVRVTFSADVEPASATSSSVSVWRDGAAVPGTLEASSNEVTFRPEQPYVLASRYELRLTAALRDKQGRPLQAFEFTFTTRDGRWGREVRADGTGPQLAMSGDGHALLVYSKSTQQYPEVLASRFSPPASWSEPMQVKPGTTGAFPGAIAFNRRHHAAVSFYSISSNVLLTGYTIGPSWLADAYLAQTAYDAKILLNEQDEVFAVMHQADIAGTGKGYSIAGFRFTLGATSPTRIQVGGLAGGNTKPSVALLDGMPHVIWQHEVTSGGVSQIMAGQLSSSDGAPLSADAVNAVESKLMADPLQSSLIAVWEQSDPTWTNVWAARIPRGGGWSEPQRISDDQSSASAVALALDPRGRALAAWRQAGGIASASFAPSTGWSAAERISAAEPTNADAPQLALDAAGNGIAAWTQDGATDNLNEVWAARYLQGEGWQAAKRVRISDLEAGTEDRITLGVDDYGRALVLWTQSNQVWSARFE